MGKITNYNNHKECADLCCEQFCSELATHFQMREINGLKLLIPLCEKHNDEIWVQDIFQQEVFQ